MHLCVFFVFCFCRYHFCEPDVKLDQQPSLYLPTRLFVSPAMGVLDLPRSLVHGYLRLVGLSVLVAYSLWLRLWDSVKPALAPVLNVHSAIDSDEVTVPSIVQQIVKVCGVVWRGGRRVGGCWEGGAGQRQASPGPPCSSTLTRSPCPPSSSRSSRWGGGVCVCNLAPPLSCLSLSFSVSLSLCMSVSLSASLSVCLSLSLFPPPHSLAVSTHHRHWGPFHPLHSYLSCSSFSWLTER